MAKKSVNKREIKSRTIKFRPQTKLVNKPIFIYIDDKIEEVEEEQPIIVEEKTKKNKNKKITTEENVIEVISTTQDTEVINDNNE